MAPGPGDMAEEETDNWVGLGPLPVEVTFGLADLGGCSREVLRWTGAGSGWDSEGRGSKARPFRWVCLATALG